MERGKRKKKTVRTIAVTSGKGGVGKSNIVANLAVSLARAGKKVLILDADLGLSNIDVLFGINSRYHIGHVLKGEMRMSEIVAEAFPGVWVLPASSGVEELTHLDEFQRLKLIDEFEGLDADIDYLLIDTGAGVSQNVAFFCVAAQKIFVVVTPEPTSLTDAYALIKILSSKYHEREFHVLVNNAKHPEDADLVFRRLFNAAERFLNISLDYYGYLPSDDSVPRAVRMQTAVVCAFPEARVSREFDGIAKKIGRESESRVKGGIQFFFGNLVKVNNDVAV